MNTITHDNTLILFGRSPFISKIADYIPDLCNKYHTMGCNYFCNTFPMVEYVIFHDDISPDVKGSTIVTNVLYERRNTSKCHELVKNYDKKELYVIHRNFKDFAADATSLNFCIHTPSMAFDWANKKGFENVVIAGIDLNSDNRHFDRNTTPDANGHNFSDKSILFAREHIYKVAQKYLNIYQLNPDSDLEVPKITISDLLSE